MSKQGFRSSCSGYQGYVHNQKETKPVLRTDPLNRVSP